MSILLIKKIGIGGLNRNFIGIQGRENGFMKAQIIALEWIPGCNINSSRGYKKNQIRKAMKTADYVVNNGFGNYSVIEYSKYIATFLFENGSTKSFDVKRQIKDAFNILRMTEKQRAKIEKLLPLDVEVNEYDVQFLSLN